MGGVSDFRLVEAIDVGDRLGEGVLWRASDQTLWWTDIIGRRLHRLDWKTGKLRTFATPERLASFGFVEGDNDRIVAAFESGFAFFNPATRGLRWFARPPELRSGRRMNDGRVGPDGCFWAGSMIEGDASEDQSAMTGLYRLNALGRARFVRGGFRIVNGICWNPGGTVMYVTDSPSRSIAQCDFNAKTGRMGNARVHVLVEDGYPDGAVTDRRGNLWSALWGAGRVACFSPEGALAGELEVPAPQPSCPAFCGPGLSFLAVTTATADLGAAERARFPQSGSLFIYEGQLAGSPNSYYRYF